MTRHQQIAWNHPIRFAWMATLPRYQWREGAVSHLLTLDAHWEELETGPRWHVTIAPIPGRPRMSGLSLWQQAQAALDGVGDPFREAFCWTGFGWHVWRSLTAPERERAGPATDLRRTDAGRRLLEETRTLGLSGCMLDRALAELEGEP